MRDLTREPRFRGREFRRKLKKASTYTRKAASLEEPRFDALRSLLRSRAVRSLLLLVALAGIYYLVFSSYFLVKKVSVTTEGVQPGAIAEVLQSLRRHRTFFVPKNHILLLTKDSLLEALRTTVPEIKGITYYRRHWPDWIELGIEQREARYVWQSGENFYFIDQDGIPFAKLQNYFPELYTQELIVDRAAADVKLGEQLEAREHLAFIENLKSEWDGQIFQTKIAGFSIPGALSSDVFARTAFGFEVYFDLERGVSAQLSSLKLLLELEIRPETYNGLSYIDVRLPNVAYYCYKDALCAK